MGAGNDGVRSDLELGKGKGRSSSSGPASNSTNPFAACVVVRALPSSSGNVLVSGLGAASDDRVLRIEDEAGWSLLSFLLLADMLASLVPLRVGWGLLNVATASSGWPRPRLTGVCLIEEAGGSTGPEAD
jgi:hypothetical protein